MGLIKGQQMILKCQLPLFEEQCRQGYKADNQIWRQPNVCIALTLKLDKLLTQMKEYQYKTQQRHFGDQ